MRHAKKSIALLLAVVLICGVCLAVTDTTVQDTGTADASATAQLLTLSTVFTFSDVPADAWYADAVAYVSNAGIMGGTSAATFSPDEVKTGPNGPMTGTSFCPNVRKSVMSEKAISMYF